MQVILLKNYKPLGKRGDIVEVKDGYGRNFLIPQGIASLAQKDIITRLKTEIKEQQNTKKREEKELLNTLKQIKNKEIKLKVKVSKKNELSSPLTRKKLNKFIYSQYKIKIPHQSIKLPSPKIKQIGEYNLYIGQEKFKLKLIQK